MSGCWGLTARGATERLRVVVPQDNPIACEQVHRRGATPEITALISNVIPSAHECNGELLFKRRDICDHAYPQSSTNTKAMCGSVEFASGVGSWKSNSESSASVIG